MLSNINLKYLLLFVFLYPIFSCQLFSQKELKRALEVNINQGQHIRDSLLQLIQITKNDTLRADLYFQYFELTSDNSERIKYSKVLINELESTLNHTKVSDKGHKALLNRKAMALRNYYYGIMNVDGAGSKKGIEQLRKAIAIYKETGNDVEIAQSYVNLADDYLRQGDLLSQLQTLQEGLKYESDRKFNRGISRFYVQLQLFYSNLGDSAQALSYVGKALALEKIIADPTREARGYYLAGLTYSRMGKHQEAINHLLRSLASYKKENMQHKDRIGQTYLLLGDEYLKVKEYDKALAIYEEILTLSTKTNDISTMFFSTLAKGRTKSLKGENSEAAKIHNGLLKLAQDVGVEHEVGKLIYKELSSDYYHAKNYQDARKNIELAIQLSDKEAVIDIYDMEELAYRIDSSSNFYEGAYKHYYQMHVLKEKLNKKEVAKSAAKERFVTELNDLKKDQEKQDAIANEEKKKQKIILLSVIGGLFLIAIFAIFVFRSLKTTRKQKILIEEKQKDILDSIRYAKRIQTSLMPTEKYIEKVLNETKTKLNN
jgi:tetratricopeptide (TPR) repeat protein